jgi:hypothetical protein
MKSTNLVLGMAVRPYIHLSHVNPNWSAIEATYEVRSSQAETALSDLKESEEAKAKIEASRAKYAALQARMKAEMEASAPNSKQQMRNSLFGENW